MIAVAFVAAIVAVVLALIVFRSEAFTAPASTVAPKSAFRVVVPLASNVAAAAISAAVPVSVVTRFPSTTLVVAVSIAVSAVAAAEVAVRVTSKSLS